MVIEYGDWVQDSPITYTSFWHCMYPMVRLTLPIMLSDIHGYRSETTFRDNSMQEIYEYSN